MQVKQQNGRLTQEIRLLIKEEYNSGCKINDLCIKYGLKKHTIGYALKSQGIILGRDIKREKLTKEEILGLINDYNSGYRVMELMDKYIISEMCVYKNLKKNNIQIRHDKKIETNKAKEILKLYGEGFTGKEISRKTNYTYSSVVLILNRRKLKLLRENRHFFRKKHKLNDDYFNVIDSQNKAYYLGLLYADGNVSKNANHISIFLQEEDQYILKSFIKELESTLTLS